MLMLFGGEFDSDQAGREHAPTGAGCRTRSSRGPAEAQAGQGAKAVRASPERNPLRLGPQTIPKFHGSARTYPAFKLFWNQNEDRDYADSAQ